MNENEYELMLQTILEENQCLLVIAQ